MPIRILTITCVALVVFAFSKPKVQSAQQTSAGFDPLRESLARDEPQPIYAIDTTDPWNEAFYLLFTRTLEARLAAEGGGPFPAGASRLALSDRTVTRIESGDRAVEPLYRSWLWMGSTAFDIASGRPWAILREPRYSRLKTALASVISSARTHPPLARALMQADLWAAYDILRTPATFRSRQEVPGAEDSVELSKRRDDLLPLLARALRSLAPTRSEIAAMPDPYALAASKHSLPDLFGAASDWIEVRWLTRRSHETAVNDRRATRVFVKPASRPSDEAAFLDGLRRNANAVDAVALVTQNLLIVDDGSVVPSPLVFEVQIRRFRRDEAGKVSEAGIQVLELSRKQLLAAPETGGLVVYDEESPAYLPIAGNDYGFATPRTLDGEPVLTRMRERCVACHSRDTARLITFAFHANPRKPAIPVERLTPSENMHAREVARRKMARAEFRALQQQWETAR